MDTCQDCQARRHQLTQPVEVERYLVVEGRRWQREDPAIPAALASERRSELMSARRAVAAAQRARDARALRAARVRVQDAKVALGERGTPWWTAWEDRIGEARLQRAAATIRALLRHRGDGKTICPSDVARANGGASWRAAMPMVRDIVDRLAANGEVVVTQRGEMVDSTRARGPIRIHLPRTKRCREIGDTRCSAAHRFRTARARSRTATIRSNASGRSASTAGAAAT